MFDKLKEMVSSITGGGDLGDLDLAGVEKYLEGITFPISKEELKTALQNNGVPDQVLGVVDKLPDQVFSSQEDLTKSLGALAGAAGLGEAADTAKAAADDAQAAASDAAGSAQAAVKDAADTAQGAVDDAANQARKQL
jgi:hypothetical protein